MKINIKKEKTHGDVLNIIAEKIKLLPKKNNNGRPNVLKIEEYLEYILFVLISGCSWDDLDLIPNMKIKGDTIRKKFNKWNIFGVFDNLFKDLLDQYVTENNIYCLFMDSYDCLNVNGNDSIVGLGHKYKGKNVAKITLLTDSNRIPFCVDICRGNIHDNKRILDVIKDLPLSLNKTYNKPLSICADKGYIINKHLNNKYRTDHNISIVTDKKKNMKKRITKKNKEILKGRIIIEHLNSVLRKKFKHLSRITDKNEKNVKRWFILSFIYLIIDYNNKIKI
jgi:transposase